MKYTRKSIRYRFFHWLNGITINDVRRAKNVCFAAIGEALTATLLFVFIFFIIPLLLH